MPDNLATLQQFYAAESNYLNQGDADFAPIALTLNPHCLIVQPSSLPYGGQWRGHAGFEAWMKAFAAEWASLEVVGTESFPTGDVVFSRSNVHAVHRLSRQHLDWPLLQYFQFRDGRILELRPFYWDTATLLAQMRK